MAGYHGWSMSNNAVQAYEDGEKPLSKWTKKTLVFALADAFDVDVEEVTKALKPYTLKEVKKTTAYDWLTSSQYDLYDANRTLSEDLQALRTLLSRTAEIDALNWAPFDADLFNRIADEI